MQKTSVNLFKLRHGSVTGISQKACRLMSADSSWWPGSKAAQRGSQAVFTRLRWPDSMPGKGGLAGPEHLERLLSSEIC